MDRNISISQAYKTMYRDYPEVVGVKDISQMLGISPKRVRQLVQENKLPHIERMLIEQQQKEEMYSKLLKSDFDRTHEGFVCRDPYGKLITPNFVSDHFKNIIRKNGLRRLRFHDLRHSCASLLLANGESMKAIQDWLGHSTFNVTANFYSHLDYSSAETIARVLGDDDDDENEKIAGSV